MSSAICFNLDLSKILLSGNGLSPIFAGSWLINFYICVQFNSLPNEKVLDWSNLNAFADDNIKALNPFPNDKF